MFVVALALSLSTSLFAGPNIHIDNFGIINPTYYRGAQPRGADFTDLSRLGIKTVIDLRAWHSDKDEVAGTGLKSVRFETEPWHADEEDVIKFRKVVSDTNNLPVFVHCKRGADRTGMMCAMYRVVVCDWTKEASIAEMKAGGFGFNPTWRNLVRYVKKADIADLKRRAGLNAGAKMGNESNK